MGESDEGRRSSYERCISRRSAGVDVDEDGPETRATQRYAHRRRRREQNGHTRQQDTQGAVGSVLCVATDIGNDVVYQRCRIQAEHKHARALNPFVLHSLNCTRGHSQLQDV